MKKHWTARSNRDFLFRIVADFIVRVEKKMEQDNISQGMLAKKLGVSKGRISQVLNDPGNVSLLTVVKFARALGMKVSVVAYEDSDPKNIQGPVISEIFETCWEKCKKPHDFWALESVRPTEITISIPPLLKSLGDNVWTQVGGSRMDYAKLSTKLYHDPKKIVFELGE